MGETRPGLTTYYYHRVISGFRVIDKAWSALEYSVMVKRLKTMGAERVLVLVS